VVRKIVTIVLHDARQSAAVEGHANNSSAAAVSGLAISTGALLAVADASVSQRGRGGREQLGRADARAVIVAFLVAALAAAGAATAQRRRAGVGASAIGVRRR
jgi:hypothetical protein